MTPRSAVAPAAALALVLALLFGAADARAVPAPPRPGLVTAPSSVGATALEVVDITLRLDCQEPSSFLACVFVTTTRLRNPTGEEVRQRVHLGPDPGAATATLDGQAIAVTARPDPKDRSGGWREVLVFPAGAVRTLVVSGTLTVSNRRYSSMFTLGANTARHLVLANHTPEKAFALRFALAPIRTWSQSARGAVAPLHVELVVPERLVVTSSLSRTGGDPVYRATYEAGAPPDELSVELDSPAPVVYPGGILAGIGGSTGAASGLRLRVGGELAATSWAFGSVVYETDARSAHYVVPAAHAALPMITLIPSLGAGLGVPVRLGPSVRAGARVQLDAHLGFLGFLTTIDVYPATATEPSLVQPTFFFQLGL